MRPTNTQHGFHAPPVAQQPLIAIRKSGSIQITLIPMILHILAQELQTSNLGVEVGLAKKWSLDLSGNYNGWKLGDEARMKHWLVQPEARYWLCEKFNGHFLAR